MGDAIAVALERCAQATLFLDVRATATLVRADGERRQPALLVLAHEALEGVSNSTGQFRHPEARLEDDRDGSPVRAPRRSGHVTRAWRAEKRDDGGDLLRLGETAERPARADRGD